MQDIPPAGGNNRPNQLPDQVFREISAIALEDAGLNIPETKKPLVTSRLAKRLRATGVEDYQSYMKLVTSDANSAERQRMVMALTTNVSGFFRERHHFEHLATTLAQYDTPAGQQKIRIWSSGCASGEEPYSIAATCLRHLPSALAERTLILGTDINTDCLARAKAAEYAPEHVAGISPKDHEALFETGTIGTVKEALKSMIRLRHLNLHADWPMEHKFDAIFCRNVTIYFAEAHRDRLICRFADALKPGGTLYLGHAESIPNPAEIGFSLSGTTTYMRLQTEAEDSAAILNDGTHR